VKLLKIDRLIGILSILLQKDKVTAAELSDKFEVLRRTIARDIVDICMAGIPHFNADGSSELTHTWSNKQNFFGMILSFGSMAEITSPPELRVEFAELVKNISDIYKT